MQGFGNGAGSDGGVAALAGDGKGGGDDLLAGESAGGRYGASPFSNMRCATCVAIVANKIPCVKGKFAIYSWIFCKASHFLHPDVMQVG